MNPFDALYFEELEKNEATSTPIFETEDTETANKPSPQGERNVEREVEATPEAGIDATAFLGCGDAELDQSIGDANKKRLVRYTISSQTRDIAMFQETKLAVVTVYNVRALWNDTNVDWVALNSVGASGGIINMWRRNSHTLRREVRGRYHVSVLFEDVYSGVCFTLSNVALTKVGLQSYWDELNEDKVLLNTIELPWHV